MATKKTPTKKVPSSVAKQNSPKGLKHAITNVFNFSTTQGKLLIFVATFAVIGGGYMVYNSFAAVPYVNGKTDENCWAYVVGPGNQGECVRRLQYALNRAKTNSPAKYSKLTILKVDGVYGKKGSNTYNDVVAFQKANGLTADGVVGEKTTKAICSPHWERNTYKTYCSVNGKAKNSASARLGTGIFGN